MNCIEQNHEDQARLGRRRHSKKFEIQKVPLNLRDTSVLAALSKSVSRAKPNTAMVMVGYFNTHNFPLFGWEAEMVFPKKSLLIQAVIFFCISHKLSQMVSFATHKVDNPVMFSCLDLIISNRPDSISSIVANPPLGNSHHVCWSFLLDASPTAKFVSSKVSAQNFSKISDET